MSVKDLCKKIINEFDLVQINDASEDCDRANSEINKLIDVLPDTDAFDFSLNYENFSLEHGTEGSGENAVQLMTIHKSKGIEFKAVFVINNSKLFNVRGTNDMIIFNKTFGAGMDRPIAGIGIGANFNNFAIEADETTSDGTVETNTNNYDVNTSFSMVLKSGAKISIPDSNFDVYALCRYNLNIPTEIKFDDNTKKSKMNASSLSAGSS